MMGAAAVVAPGVALASDDWTAEDAYWEAQWQIMEYEQDRREMLAHMHIMGQTLNVRAHVDEGVPEL
jgi:hypothetical protein